MRKGLGTMGNGKWEMANGKWQVGKQHVANGQHKQQKGKALALALAMIMSYKTACAVAYTVKAHKDFNERLEELELGRRDGNQLGS
jgi:hypothetical protein